MRRINTPPSLKWLINKRARIEGEIQYIEAISSRLESSKLALIDAERRYLALRNAHEKRLQLINERLPKLKNQFEAINITIGIHEIQIDPDLIRPIRPQIQKRLLPFGQITRDIYICLKDLGGSATTKQIARYIMGKHQVLQEEISLVRLTRLVRKNLQRLVYDGKITRTHPKTTIYEGTWKLPS